LKSAYDDTYTHILRCWRRVLQELCVLGYFDESFTPV